MKATEDITMRDGETLEDFVQRRERAAPGLGMTFRWEPGWHGAQLWVSMLLAGLFSPGLVFAFGLPGSALDLMVVVLAATLAGAGVALALGSTARQVSREVNRQIEPVLRRRSEKRWFDNEKKRFELDGGDLTIASEDTDGALSETEEA